MASKSHPASEKATTKEERKRRSLANLEKHKIQKGEVRNPTGINGRKRSDLIASILDEVDEKTGESHIRSIVMASVKRAKRSSDKAANFLIEQYGGKAEVKAKVDVTSSDGSMSGGGYPVVVQLPPNGRPMNEDAEASTEAQSDGDGAENS